MTDYPTNNMTYVNGRIIRLIVIHTMETEATDSANMNVMHEFQTPAKGASTHYGVGPNTVYSGVPEEHIAWAAPGANSDGIQIEQTGFAEWTSQWDSGDPAKVVANTARLVGKLAARHNIPLKHLTDAELYAGHRGIIGHDQASRVYKQSNHWDPGPAYPWDRMLALAGGQEDETQLEGENDMYIAHRRFDHAYYLISGTAMTKLLPNQLRAFSLLGVKAVSLNPDEVLEIMTVIHDMADDEQNTQRAFDRARAAEQDRKEAEEVARAAREAGKSE